MSTLRLQHSAGRQIRSTGKRRTWKQTEGWLVSLPMGPNADVELDASGTAPVLPAPVHARVAGAQTGDAYERHAAEVYGFLVRTIRDGEAAADLLADVFTKLLVEERASRWPDQPRAWLYRVASNLAMSRGRRLQVAARVDRVLQMRFERREH